MDHLVLLATTPDWHEDAEGDPLWAANVTNVGIISRLGATVNCVRMSG